MKGISRWGRAHVKATWVLITVFSIVVTFLALFLGIVLAFKDVIIPGFIFSVSIAIFIMASFLYPFRGVTHGLWRHSYLRQKTCDLIVTFTGFLMIMCLANGFLNSQASHVEEDTKVHKVSLSGVSLVIDHGWSDNSKHLRKWIRKHKKELRQTLKTMKKKYKEEGNKKGVAFSQVLLIFLTLGIGLVLLTLIAGLACSLSCDGHDGAAALVMIGGGTLIIFLMVITIRGIIKLYKSQEG